MTSDFQKRKRPALRDVAKEAGVGPTTVSRVINGGHYVDPLTLAKVQKVIDRLGYRPNQAARSLKSEQTRTIGLIIPTIKDIFFASLADTVQKIARQNGYLLVLLTSDDDAVQQTAELKVFENYRVDGILLAPPRSSKRSFLAAVRALRVPAVAIDRPLDPEFCAVVCDNYTSAKAATEHLLAHGRKRIFCLGGDPELYTIQERLRGYRDAMRTGGFEANHKLAFGRDAIVDALTEVLAGSSRRRPDAILSLYNTATTTVYEVLSDQGIGIPDPIALFGFDDFPLSTTLRPSVSVVAQPVNEIGQAAAHLLLNRIKNPGLMSQTITIAAHLQPRGSCGC